MSNSADPALLLQTWWPGNLREFHTKRLSETVEGKKNDKRLADESGYCVPKDSVLAHDAGFQGFHLDPPLYTFFH